MKPPPFTDIDPLMREWVDSVDQLRSEHDQPFPERLAGVHNAFERIHPFLDGNGRTGRLLLNLVLARLGYPPAIIFKHERTKYLKAMRKADNGDFGPLGEHIARAVTDNLYRFVLPAIAGPARLVPLASLVDVKAGPSAPALRIAAQRASCAEAARWQMDVFPQVARRIPGQPLQALIHKRIAQLGM